MHTNPHNRTYFSSAKIISATPKGFPFMPGLGFILLGVIIFLAPKFFLAALSAFFILLGAACCYIAWKFVCFKRRVTKLAEDFQNSVEVRAFHVQNNDDIDITEPDSKKILFH